MDIRVAVRNDIEPLVSFNQAMALETEGKELDTQTLWAGVAAVFDDPNKGFYVVAQDEEEIVAGLMVTFEWSDWRNNWFWWIQSVYVLPKARGKHIYSDLYDFVKQKASAEGNVCGFRLYVEKENLRAQKVYETVGMERSYYLMYEELA
jgi:GNAT superfamily N-acetyltransferase